MSIETDFRAVLAGHASLTALVQGRISQNAVEQGTPLPIVVFGSSRDADEGLDGDDQVELCTFSVECWAETGIAAGAVADQVKAAVDAYDATQGAVSVAVVSRQTAYDGELKLDGVILTIEWWRL